MRIVYVEDNLANLALVRRVARMGQHTVQAFANGYDALTYLRTTPADLVLVDIQLSGDMDGLELAAILRKENVAAPIIAVTAYTMLGDRERCIAAGCIDYLPKPLPVSELVAIFEKYSVGLEASNQEE